MKLHTNLTYGQVYGVLKAAQDKGFVTPDVTLVVFEESGSRTHDRAFEVQLGTDDKNSLPGGTVDQYGKKMNVRRFKNSGQYGADRVYSATWFEWGWFMAEVFAADPTARFGDKSIGYSSRADFDAKTDNRFVLA